ncbi:MAG: phosphoribosylanthranilate isomerase [Clostridium sp.]|nr:phosphoribosylanthranilate isomerase [Clostridium sp.]
MIGVKICGLKRIEDIEYINQHKPLFAGFVFAKSRRQVTKEGAGVLIQMLCPKIKSVGVFVDEDIERVVDIVKHVKLDCVQLHGNEPPQYVSEISRLLRMQGLGRIEIWKGMRVKDKGFIGEMDKYDVDAFLLDAYSEGCYGGSGKSFDWELASIASKKHKVILAGGLTPKNVAKAIRIADPFAVDVSSGVETNGVKDEGKIAGFIDVSQMYLRCSTKKS